MLDQITNAVPQPVTLWKTHTQVPVASVMSRHRSVSRNVFDWLAQFSGPALDPVQQLQQNVAHYIFQILNRRSYAKSPVHDPLDQWFSVFKEQALLCRAVKNKQLRKKFVGAVILRVCPLPRVL